MTGKLILASNKTSKKIVEKKSVSKVKEELNSVKIMKEDLAKIGIGTPESKWQILPIVHEAEVLTNTIYHDLGNEIPVTLNITNEIHILLDITMPGVYKGLIDHINAIHGGKSNFSTINASCSQYGIVATKIMINELDHPSGYYLPDLNTFIFGNISWHKHYSEIVMPAIWPQILEKLNIA